jgi:starvation-inducible DNA-binding protein
VRAAAAVRTTTRGRSQQDAVSERLNHHLALAADLYSQVKQAHWNVVGANFIALHRLFDEQAAMFAAHVDLYAERMRALQAVPAGTIRQAVRESDLPDLDARELAWDEAVEAILQRFESYGRSLKDAIEHAERQDDLVTQDLYIGTLHETEKHAYFLRSHLGG